MTGLAAWTPTDAASDPATRSTGVIPPGNTLDPLETGVWSKNQMKKFPFMSRRKREEKKGPCCSEGLCQEAELFFFLNRW